MFVGVPKEIKLDEHPVGLTPESVAEFVRHGHEVLVETNAGIGIGATDEDYRLAGADIVGSAREIFSQTDLIIKVKEPQPQEWCQLGERQILFTYLHLASDPAQAKGLMASGVTAVAYETVTGKAGQLPLLAPMSEVAGRLSIQAAARGLEMHSGGTGLLLGGVAGVKPARVDLCAQPGDLALRARTGRPWPRRAEARQRPDGRAQHPCGPGGQRAGGRKLGPQRRAPARTDDRIAKPIQPAGPATMFHRPPISVAIDGAISRRGGAGAPYRRLDHVQECRVGRRPPPRRGE